jgi:membrane protein YqaA with SNARE-associated domain
MLRTLYDRLIGLAASPRAEFWLALTAFAEASFFPVPPDALLVPMCLARPDRALRYALVCTAASVAGGCLGYAIGYWLFDAVARPILAAYGQADALTTFESWYARWGAALILVKGLTPIPYKIVTIASGAAHFDFGIFLLASLATRGARFFVLALLLRRYGESVRDFIERRLTLVTTGALAAAVLGVVALRWL